MEGKNDRFKILHLIATNFYGGPEKQIVEHLKLLDRSRFHPVLASFLEKNVSNEILEVAGKAGLEIRGIPMNSPIDLAALKELKRIILEEKTDLLCLHGYKSCVMGWWISRKLKIHAIAFCRGFTRENLKVAFYEWIQRRILGKLFGVVCVSEGQKRVLDSFGVRCKRAWIVHNAVRTNGIDLGASGSIRETVIKKFDIPEESFIVVTAGRLSPEKGHRVLVDAIHELGEISKKTIFMFCGDGQCRLGLERRAKELGVQDRCRFTGFRRDLQEIFQAMDLFVLPSFTEGLPNVILESFACAKPVVATSVGGVPEIVEDGKNGYLVPPGRPDEIADAIMRCLRSPDLMTEMGKSGFDLVKSKFTFEMQNKILEEIYTESLCRDAAV